MTSILQMDIKDLFKKKEPDTKDNGSTGIQKILLLRILGVLLLIVFLLLVYWYFLKPKNDEQNKKIDELSSWNDQIISCNQEIELLNNEYQKLIQYQKNKSKLFVSSEEFENFYANLTEATVRFGLRIIDITRMEEEPVYVSENIDEPAPSTNENNISVNTAAVPCNENIEQSILDSFNTNKDSNQQDVSNCNQDSSQECEIAYIKMLVNFEIRGSFINYIKFRNIIANEQKIVNIEKEDIIKDESLPGQIIAKATVSLVKVPE